MNDFKDTITALGQELCTTLVSKNNDYGDSFHQMWMDYGIVQGVIRIADKFSRIKNLTKNGQQSLVQDESIRDTFMDLAGYALLTVRELDREKEEKDA